MSDESRIARGRRFAAAKDVIDEVFEGIRGHLLEQIEQAPSHDADDILEMHRGLKNLARLKLAVRRVIEDGDVVRAAAEAERLNRA